MTYCIVFCRTNKAIAEAAAKIPAGLSIFLLQFNKISRE